jgi:uncharacterized protein YndB with AHSA1/START domain
LATADNSVTDAADNVKKKDLVGTSDFDAPIERVWKARPDPDMALL